MILNLLKSLKTCALALCLAATLSTTSAQILTGSVGTGDDISYLVIQASDFGPDPLVYAYHYTYDSDNPLNSYELFTAIVGAEPFLDASFINYGDSLDPNYFLTAITFHGTTLTNVGAPTYSPYWAQWVSGGEAGFPTAAPIAAGTWTLGSGMSAPYRFLAPGSWDGFIYNDGNTAPDISPVPEPTVLAFLGAGGFALLFRRRLRAA